MIKFNGASYNRVLYSTVYRVKITVMINWVIDLHLCFLICKCKKVFNYCTTHVTIYSAYNRRCFCCFQFGLDGDDSLYRQHIQPLVYGCAIILPIIYVVGVVFTLKTHTSYVYDEFYEQLRDDCDGKERKY